MKDDSNKTDLTYLRDINKALTEVCKVFEYGAIKYQRNSWKNVDVSRYEAALLRHALQDGSDESGLLHAAHTAWNALAVLELKLTAQEFDATRVKTAQDITMFIPGVRTHTSGYTRIKTTNEENPEKIIATYDAVTY